MDDLVMEFGRRVLSLAESKEVLGRFVGEPAVPALEEMAAAMLHAWNNIPETPAHFTWPADFPEGSQEAWRRVAMVGHRLTVGRGALDAEVRGSNPPASTNTKKDPAVSSEVQSYTP